MVGDSEIRLLQCVSVWFVFYNCAKLFFVTVRYYCFGMVLLCDNCCIYIMLSVYCVRLQFLRCYGLFNVGLSWLGLDYTPCFRNGFGFISKRRFFFYYLLCEADFGGLCCVLALNWIKGVVCLLNLWVGGGC
jgi:hypothetical protein